jgi:hypothetical protein
VKYLVHIEHTVRYKLIVEADSRSEAMIEAEGLVYEGDACPAPFSEHIEAASITELEDDDQEAPE